jgi:hypothetical protein
VVVVVAVLVIEEIETAKQHQAVQGKMLRLQGKTDRPKRAMAAEVVLAEVEPTVAMAA